MKKKPASYLTVGTDLFRLLLSWTIGSLIVFMMVHVIRVALKVQSDSFYSVSYVVSNIYMLVIGIISAFVLIYFVENGVTRKNYFFGNVIASIVLSIFIPIAIYVIDLVEKVIINQVTSIDLNDQKLESLIVDMDGNIISEIIQSIILTPFVHPNDNLLAALALFSLNIFVFYLAGWLIGATFNRFKVVGGILVIILSVALVAVKDSMLRLSLDYPLFESFSFLGNVPSSLALPIVLAVVLFMIVLIRLMTKRATIRV